MNNIASSHSETSVRHLPARLLTRAALLLPLAAALLASAPAARAQVTYNITPVILPDLNNPSFTDTLSGTIIMSATGVYTTSNDSSVSIDYYLTMQSTNGAIDVENASGGSALSAVPLFLGTLTATPTALTLSPDADLFIEAGGGTVGVPYVVAEWEPQNNALSIYSGTQGDAASMQIFDTSADTYMGTPPWTIATAVPEPGSVTLALAGGLGLLALRRRRKKMPPTGV